MAITFIALLVVAGLFFGGLITMILLAVNAKTTGGRVAVLATGFVLLFGVPLAMVMVSFVTVRTTTTETGPVDIAYDEPHEIVENGTSERPIAATPRGTPPRVRSSAPAPVLAPTEIPRPVDQAVAHHWDKDAEGTFAASVYPSVSSAFESIVQGIDQTLIENRVLAVDDKQAIVLPETILLTGYGEQIEGKLPEYGIRISKDIPGASVLSGGKVADKPAAKTLSVHLEMGESVRQFSPWSADQQITHGELICKFTSTDGQLELRAFVTEKPWVESFDRFVSMHPGRRFVVGYSDALHSSESAARTSAMNDAIKQATITQGNRVYALVDERHVLDRFAQRLSRPYGDVWREAVLIELPDPGEMAAASQTAAERFREDSLLRTAKHAGVVFLVLATVLLCWLLNWITKGYYRSHVVLGVIGAMIVGFLILIMFVA